jgi:dTDP-4-dehydrorhamnose 3,5-epimerase
MVLNFPNRLFAGRGKKLPVDEIRYEDAKDTPFVMNG